MAILKLSELIKEERTVIQFKGEKAADIIIEMANKLEDVPLEKRRLLSSVLIDREFYRTTNIGKGVAIPHARLAFLKEYCIVAGTSLNGIKTHAWKQPAHCFFMLGIPFGLEQRSSYHLDVVAAISRFVRSGDDSARRLAQFSDYDEFAMFLRRIEKA